MLTEIKSWVRCLIRGLDHNFDGSGSVAFAAPYSLAVLKINIAFGLWRRRETMIFIEHAVKSRQFDYSDQGTLARSVCGRRVWLDDSQLDRRSGGQCPPYILQIIPYCALSFQWIMAANSVGTVAMRNITAARGSGCRHCAVKTLDILLPLRYAFLAQAGLMV